jgi:biotin carboxylase
MLIHNEKELKESVAYSSENGRSGGVIIEEYMRGPEVSVEVVTIDGEPHVLQVTDKLTTGAPHFVEMGHSQPSRLAESDLAKIRDLASRAVKAVGIKNGPAHVEIILTENGPKMVELGARMGGDCITTHLVPLSTGIDMIEATIRIACGEKPDITPKFEKGSAIRFLDAPHGTISSIEGIDEAEKIDGVREISFTKGIGDVIGNIGSSTDRAGFVIAQADTAEDAVDVCERARDLINIATE